MCACLPGARPFITKFFPRLFSYRNHYYPYPSRGGGTGGRGGGSIPLSRTVPASNLQTSINGTKMAPGDGTVDGDGDGDAKQGSQPGIQVTTAIYSREDSASHVDDDGSSVRHLV